VTSFALTGIAEALGETIAKQKNADVANPVIDVEPPTLSMLQLTPAHSKGVEGQFTCDRQIGDLTSLRKGRTKTSVSGLKDDGISFTVSGRGDFTSML